MASISRDAGETVRTQRLRRRALPGWCPSRPWWGDSVIWLPLIPLKPCHMAGSEGPKDAEPGTNGGWFNKLLWLGWSIAILWGSSKEQHKMRDQSPSFPIFSINAFYWLNLWGARSQRRITVGTVLTVSQSVGKGT